MRNRMFIALGIATAIGFALILPSVQPGLGQDKANDILSRENVLRDPDNPVLGNPKGDVTIVEYFDYQCPYCKKVDPVLMQVAQEDGKVRIVLKDWPIFGGASMYAAKMVLASKFQNKYADAHKALISTKIKLTQTVVDDLLRNVGVDVARATADLEANKGAIDALLARNNAQAEAFGFRGTPAFIIGTFRVPGALDAASFKRAIKDARSAAARR